MKRLVAILTPIHRYLGIAFCVIFVAWFASGLVMIYHAMPAFDPIERSARLTPLVVASVHLTPREALLRAEIGAPPTRIRLTTLRGRPIYRFLVDGEWVSVFADDGSMLERVSADDAVRIIRAAFPDRQATIHLLGTIEQPDQWTLETSFRTFGPLHVVALGDDVDTHLYVGSTTGDIVMKTDRPGRRWAYVGPVVHWFYFRPFRANAELWFNTVVYASVTGCIVAMLGIVIGIYRYSLARRYYQGTSSTPYAGWLRWHHYAGLLFGMFAFTWVLSGLLSMEPWGLSEDNSPGRDQLAAIRGEGVDAARFTVTPSEALATAGAAFTTKELDLIQFMGAPYYRAQDATGRTGLIAAAGHAALKDGFTRRELIAAARAAMPAAHETDITWLTTYDAYYYDRTAVRPLPVLRVKYSDPSGSWLYLSARDGALVQRETARGRPWRWLYHGLHSLDFPGLYASAWLWQVVIVTLCTGGLLLSLTSLVVGWKSLRRRA